MAARGERDFFDKARLAAAVILLASAGVAIAGSLLEWVAIGERPQLVERARFERQEIPVPERTAPLSGLEVRDGRWTLAGGVVLAVAALFVVVRKTAAWGWLAFAACLLIGAIAFADYRAVRSTEFARRMEELGLEIVGERNPGLGLTMVAIAAVAGVIGAVGAIAASPGDERRYNEATL